MSEGVKPLAEKLLDTYWKGKDAPRRNELRNELVGVLNAIANRIDQGYNLEVRAEPSAPAQEGEGEEAASRRAHIEQIMHSALGMQYLRPVGDPLLSLPELTQEETSDAPASKADEDGRRKSKK
jgi:hypothetical protein